MGFYGMFGQVMSLSVFYNVTAKYSLPPWLNYWLLLATAVLVGIILSLISWKIVIPSNVSNGNQQGWEHDNPSRGLMEAEFALIKAELASIRAELKK